jgi:hypothetical protein
MELQDLFLAILLLCVLYWYFNIRGLRKCITYNPMCDGIKCIKFKMCKL